MHTTAYNINIYQFKVLFMKQWLSFVYEIKNLFLMSAAEYDLFSKIQIKSTLNMFGLLGSKQDTQGALFGIFKNLKTNILLQICT